MTDCPLSGATILLLDSYPVMRAALRDALQNAGYLVLTAGDLGTAVDRLKEDKPELLILPPYINSMPGHLAADYLRTRQPGLPVRMVAGFMDDDRVNVQNAVEEFHTFPKSFTRDQFLSKVRDVLKYQSEKAIRTAQETPSQ